MPTINTKKLETDDADISDIKLSMSFWWNGDYYVTLEGTPNGIGSNPDGEKVQLTMRVSMSWWTATEVQRKAIAQLFRALMEQENI